MIIEHYKSIKQYNTFGVDTKAKNFASISSIEDLSKIIDAGLTKDNFFILGGGSNLLFVGDFDGTILKNDLKGIKIIDTENDFVLIEVASGEKWHDFVTYCVQNKLFGLENLALIPGTVGSAPVQNIGAYGVEQKDYFHSLSAIDCKNGKNVDLTLNECKFSYRYSVLKEPGKRDMFITSVRYKISKKENPNIAYKDLRNYFSQQSNEQVTARDVFEAVCSIRQGKLPDPAEIGNAGSFFKNPVVTHELFIELKNLYPDVIGFPQKDSTVKLSAAWLIEKDGWKGKRYKDAGVYEKHSLILVNHGNASGKDIFDLSEMIRKSVMNRFGINLEREIIIIGS